MNHQSTRRSRSARHRRRGDEEDREPAPPLQADRPPAHDRKGDVAMFADVAAKWPGRTIEVVSGYRAMRSESRTSPHRAARRSTSGSRASRRSASAITCGATSAASGSAGIVRELRTLDYRPALPTHAWTFRHGKNRYRPSWAERIRPAYEEPPRTHRKGAKHRRTNASTARARWRRGGTGLTVGELLLQRAHPAMRHLLKRQERPVTSMRCSPSRSVQSVACSLQAVVLALLERGDRGLRRDARAAPRRPSRTPPRAGPRRLTAAAMIAERSIRRDPGARRGTPRLGARRAAGVELVGAPSNGLDGGGSRRGGSLSDRCWSSSPCRRLR